MIIGKRRLRRLKTESGQGLVELVILLPLLILLVAGGVDLGRIFFAQVSITNAAREAARYGVTRPNDTPTIQSRAYNEAAGSLDLGVNNNRMAVQVNYDPNGQTIAVTVNYQFTTLFIGQAIRLIDPDSQVLQNTNDINLTGQSVMPVLLYS